MLEKLLNLQIEDIVITGYTESKNNYYYFSPMNWWTYLIIDKKIIEFDSNDGDIVFKEVDKIDCKFDMEGNDISEYPFRAH